MDIDPRFPIMGGWKSNFFIGFNLPSKFSIFSDLENKYVLNLTYGMPFDTSLAKNYTLRVVLPEGASDIKVKLIFYHF